MIFNMLLFIVVIIEQVTLEQLYMTVSLFVFVQQFLIFISIVANVTAYEFAGVPLAA